MKNKSTIPKKHKTVKPMTKSRFYGSWNSKEYANLQTPNSN